MSSRRVDRRGRKRAETHGSREIKKPARVRSAAAISHGDTNLPHLSPREREIVGLLIDGLTVKEASAALDLSPRTVEGYLDRLKRRFGKGRLLALVVHIVKQGLLVVWLVTGG